MTNLGGITNAERDRPDHSTKCKRMHLVLKKDFCYKLGVHFGSGPERERSGCFSQLQDDSTIDVM